MIILRAGLKTFDLTFRMLLNDVTGNCGPDTCVFQFRRRKKRLVVYVCIYAKISRNTSMCDGSHIYLCMLPFGTVPVPTRESGQAVLSHSPDAIDWSGRMETVMAMR